MGFLYPRTIQITRPVQQSGVGALPYGGSTVATETSIASNVPAAIQLKKEGGKMPADLPLDIAKRSFWNIFFNLPLGTVLDRDIITDDTNLRYQVSASYWTPLGYQCLCERLET